MGKQKNQTEKYKELLKEYKRLAKKADQRLVRIEKEAASGGKYASMINFAYKKAQLDIRKWSGEGSKRFNVRAPTSTVSLKAKIKDIETFLKAPSSTIKPTKENAIYNDEGKIIGGGMQLTFDKRAQTLNEKYGKYLDTPFTWENVGDFFESALWKKMDKKYADSGTTLKAIGMIKRNARQVAQEINEGKPSHIHVDDMILEKRVNHLLRYYKKDLSKLF